MTEDEIVGWHHQLDGREFEQTLGDSEGQRRWACCSAWSIEESGTTLATEQQGGDLGIIFIAGSPRHPSCEPLVSTITLAGSPSYLV